MPVNTASIFDFFQIGFMLTLFVVQKYVRGMNGE